MRLSGALFALVLAAAPLRAADVTLPDCFPPGTRVLFGISLRGLIDSPTLKGLGADLHQAGAEMLKSNPIPGLDPLKDIDDLILGSTGEGDQSPMLIVVRGRFPLDHLPAGTARYHDVALWTNPKDATGALAMLDASTAIAGSLAQVHAAIDRRGTPSALPPALAGSALSLASRFDVWGVGDLPKGLPATPGSPSQLDSLDHFEFGAALRQGLEVNGQLHVRDDKDAQKLAGSVKMMEALIKAQQPSASSAKLDISTDHGTLKFALMIPEEELKKGIAANQSALLEGFRSGMKLSAAPPKPSTKPVIEKRKDGDTFKVTLPGGR